ncbi:ABC transporter substrate-binding protein [Teichococcus aestuarii]|uniref:ABC transporter substrate-binding protein n=1 Tax=Teichococcus aestuarii TaxID=568898 RepID=UPI003608C54A
MPARCASSPTGRCRCCRSTSPTSSSSPRPRGAQHGRVQQRRGGDRHRALSPASWQPGQPLVLERNASYHGTAPAWSRVTFRPIPSDGARVGALLAGDVDFINAVPLQDVARLEKTEGARRLRVFSGPSAYVYMLFPELEKEPLPGVRDAQGQPLAKNPWKDPKVREAVSLALNRTAIVERLMEGRARVANQAVPESFFGHSGKIAPARFDLERARALLREAGYPNGFQTSLACPNDRFVNDSKICEAAAQQLQRAGIRVDLNAQPRATFFPARARREWPLHAAGWGSLTGESSYFLTSRCIPRTRNSASAPSTTPASATRRWTG